MKADTVEIQTPRVFLPLLQPSRYKGVYGGRGSGKSFFFAALLVEYCVLHPGTRAVCLREIQKSLKDSAKLIIEDMIRRHFPHSGFRILADRIETPGGGLIIFNGLKDQNADSIKSLEGFMVAWVEEAQALSSRSLSLLRPTIRAEGSELWFSWNPQHKNDPVDKLLRDDVLPPDSIVIEANYHNNPFFPNVLEQERLFDKDNDPDQYPHIWEGKYATVNRGAYYASRLMEARKENRIGNVGEDPLMTKYAVWDIGGTGRKADATAIWICQFIGKEVRLLNYYEAQGQDLATHIGWLKSHGYGDVNCKLPHDGATNDKVYDVSYESALRAAGFEVEVIPNQGKGAAMARVDAGRRMFPSIWVNKETCEYGLDALGWYHEKIDETRQIGLGPDHDWSSHCADAFGLIAVIYEIMTQTKQPRRRLQTVSMP